jgi:hypothetical protein
MKDHHSQGGDHEHSIKLEIVGRSNFACSDSGVASVPPRELAQRNDHGGLTAWYQEEAREIRMRAEEMRLMGKEYEKFTPKQGQQSNLVQHCRNLEEKYTKAAEELDALAKLHAEQGKTQ